MPDRLIVATEALASGLLTRRVLRRRYTKVHRNVYTRRGVELSAVERVYGAWLWSGRRATLAGHSAAAWLGDKWIPANAPVELVHPRRGKPRGITIRSSRFRSDEVRVVRGVACTTPARTAYDLGRLLPVTMGVIRIDMLLNATGVGVETVAALAERYAGARGIRTLRRTLDLVDAGSESPQETRLRLLLVRAGLPRPVTQIPVEHGGERRRIDMGWPEWSVGVEYDGEQHFTDATGYADDIDRLEFLDEQGWAIVARVTRALERRMHAS